MPNCELFPLLGLELIVSNSLGGSLFPRKNVSVCSVTF